jgi:Zn-dependent protease/predicted transcriptional regulator
MPSAFHLLTVRGIPIRIHITFIWFPIWAAFVWSSRGDDVLRGALFGVIAALFLFLCVTLHELGHALMAQRFGIKVEDITLLPFGGLARLRTIPKEPKKELAIAIAGPLVNVAIFFVLAFVAGFIYRNETNITPDFLLDELDRGNANSLLIYLMLANIILVLFNLIPAFPLDGGRVLRALLALKMPWVRATRIAATTGLAFAALFVVSGIAARDFFLSLVGLMVGFGAWQERQMAEIQAQPKWVPAAETPVQRVVVVSRATVGNAMTAPPPTVGLSQRINELADLAPAASVAGALPVMDRDNYVIGVLPAARLVAGLRDQPNSPVLELMRRTFPIARPAEPLYEQWYKTSAEDQHYVVVLEDDGRLAGWLTRADISQGLRVTQPGQPGQPTPDSAWQELDREFV